MICGAAQFLLFVSDLVFRWSLFSNWLWTGTFVKDGGRSEIVSEASTVSITLSLFSVASLHRGTITSINSNESTYWLFQSFTSLSWSSSAGEVQCVTGTAQLVEGQSSGHMMTTEETPTAEEDHELSDCWTLVLTLNLHLSRSSRVVIFTVWGRSDLKLNVPFNLLQFAFSPAGGAVSPQTVHLLLLWVWNRKGVHVFR